MNLRPLGYEQAERCRNPFRPVAHTHAGLSRRHRAVSTRLATSGSYRRDLVTITVTTPGTLETSTSALVSNESHTSGDAGKTGAHPACERSPGTDGTCLPHHLADCALLYKTPSPAAGSQGRCEANSKLVNTKRVAVFFMIPCLPLSVWSPLASANMSLARISYGLPPRAREKVPAIRRGLEDMVRANQPLTAFT